MNSQPETELSRLQSLIVVHMTDHGKSKSGCCAIQEHVWFYITMGHGKGKGRASVEQVMATSSSKPQPI